MYAYILVIKKRWLCWCLGIGGCCCCCFKNVIYRFCRRRSF